MTSPAPTPTPAAPATPAAVAAEPVFFGLDVAKAKLDLGRTDTRAVVTFENSPAGHAALVRHLRAACPPGGATMGTLVLEATGGYERAVLDALLDAQVPVARVNPGRVRAMATALAKHAKTDLVDARLLAEFGRMARPRLAEREAAARAELHALVTCRRQLLETRTMHGNRRQLTTDKHALRAIDAVLRATDRELKRLDARIRKLIDADEPPPAAAADMKDADRILQSVPGVGPALSAVLLAELQELGTTCRRRIASLAGVAPFDDQSGPRDGLKHIRGGRTSVRNTLYMAAVTAARCNPVIKPFYDRLRAKGYKAKYALTACMRKLLALLNAMLRDGLTWDQMNVAKPA
jgi:transposase